MNRLKKLAERIYHANPNQYIMAKIELNDFQRIPSNNDFMFRDPVKITKLNAYRLAMLILCESQFTHIINTNLGKKNHSLRSKMTK